MYSVERIDADFSSEEAAVMSGVCQNLQYEWRRRGILPQQEGRKRVRYNLFQVAWLKVLGILSKASVRVMYQQALAWQIAALVSARVVQLREAAIVEGLDLTDDEFEVMVEGMADGPLGTHFTLFRLPEPPDNSGIPHAYVGATSFADLQEMVKDGEPIGAALVMESMTLAREIVAAAPRPLVTYKITGEAE